MASRTRNLRTIVKLRVAFCAYRRLSAWALISQPRVALRLAASTSQIHRNMALLELIQGRTAT
jgi:hypothetical protein